MLFEGAGGSCPNVSVHGILSLPSDLVARPRSFVKMHGLQNHFVIFDGRTEQFRPAKSEIVRICDAHTGVGAEQLLVLEQPSAKGHGASARMRIYNVDGHEAEACGNATRCVAWLLTQESQTDTVSIETQAGVLACSRLPSECMSVRVELGRVLSRCQDIPLTREVETLPCPQLRAGPLVEPCLLSIGNPHAVFFVEGDFDSVEINKWAPIIAKDSLFPEQVNVGIAQIIDETNLRLVVYERSVGITRSCGSGACVAVFAAKARGFTSANAMDVHMPAGKVTIEITEGDRAIMTGPVAYCFSGQILCETTSFVTRSGD